MMKKVVMVNIILSIVEVMSIWWFNFQFKNAFAIINESTGFKNIEFGIWKIKVIGQSELQTVINYPLCIALLILLINLIFIKKISKN